MLYDKNAKCSKCGDNDVTTEYAYGKMQRKCRNCGYSWAEDPLDHKSPINVMVSDLIPKDSILFITKDSFLKMKDVKL